MNDKKLISLYTSICKYDCENNAKKVKEKMELYLQQPHVAISASLLEIYALALKHLREYEKSYQVYQIIKEFYPTCFVEDKMEGLSSLLGKIQESISQNLVILEKRPLDFNAHYHLGYLYLIQNNLEKSQYYFENCLLLTEEEEKMQKVKSYLTKIQEHKQSGTFLETSYEAFLDQGKTLQVGHIVSVKEKMTVQNNSQENFDPKNQTRIYYLWKIEGDKLYAFGFTTNIKHVWNYCIVGKNYNMGLSYYSGKMQGQNDIIIFTKDQIRTVIDQLTKKDFKNLLFKTYYAIKNQSLWRQELRKPFLDEIEKQYKKTYHA